MPTHWAVTKAAIAAIVFFETMTITPYGFDRPDHASVLFGRRNGLHHPAINMK